MAEKRRQHSMTKRQQASLLSLCYWLITGFVTGWLLLAGIAVYLGVSQSQIASYHFCKNLLDKQLSVLSSLDMSILTTKMNELVHYIGDSNEALMRGHFGQGVLSATSSTLNGIVPNSSGFTESAVNFIHNVIVFALYITEAMFIKVAVLLLALPVFILAVFNGFADGLTIRAIRTAELGRESSYMFHRFSKLAWHFLVLSLFAYFIAPVAVEPQFTLVPMAIVLMIFVSLAVSRFKKYL